MARVKLTGLVSSINGSSGGTTYQNSIGGTIMRSKPIPLKRTTNKRQVHRSNIDSILQAWSGLTIQQILLWEQFAVYRNIKQKNNSARTISGQQIFIRENSLRKSMEGYDEMFFDPIHTAPILVTPPLPVFIISVNRNVGDLNLHLSKSIVVGQEAVLLWMSKPLRHSQKSINTERKMIKFSSIDGDVQVITDAYLEAWGKLPETGDMINGQVGIYSESLQTYTTSPVGIGLVE